MAEAFNADFKSIWKLLYELKSGISNDIKDKSIDFYCYSLFDRALSILDAYVLLEEQKNIPVKHILLRCLYELKIKSSIYQDDSKAAIHEANVEIKREGEYFLKLVREGTSFLPQILRQFISTHVTINIPEGIEIKKKTIKKKAEEADLYFDYELLYWLDSLYIHSNPLALMLDHLYNSNKESEILKALNILANDKSLISLNFANTMAWISHYLYADKMSESTKIIYERTTQELRNKFPSNLSFKGKLGEMNIKFPNMEELNLKRNQRK